MIATQGENDQRAFAGRKESLMKKIPDDIRQKIISMYSNGKLHREIHDETGISMATISRVCRAAGIDKIHIGGKVTKTIQVTPDLPAPAPKPEGLLLVTARTLKLRGFATDCEYTAGTDLPSVDITLGDWALSIEVDKLDGFIGELQHLKKMLCIA